MVFINLAKSALLFSLSTISSGFTPEVARSFVVRGGSSGSTALNMAAAEVKVGDTLPSVTLMEGQANYEKPVPVNLSELISGKKVAIFAVPGAFTPGCSKSHLPSFITAQDDLKAKEMTICVATNDAYVM